MRICLVLALAFLLLAPATLMLPVHANISWVTQTIDTTLYGSAFLALDSNGYPHVAYNHLEWKGSPNGTYLNYASWNGSGWDVQTVANGMYVEDFKLDSNDNPHMLCSGQPPNTLYYVSGSGSNWVMQPIGDEGNGESLVLDSSDNPHIIYVGGDGGGHSALKYAYLSDSGWKIETIDANASNVGYGFLALDSQDTLHILYETLETNKTTGYFTTNINYAMRNGTGWNKEKVFDGSPVRGFSLGNLVLDRNGYPHFTYVNQTGNSVTVVSPLTLIYAGCNGSSWTQHVVSSDIVDSESWLALDSNGYPHIIYNNETGMSSNPNLVNEPVYTSWNGTGWVSQKVDSANGPGSFGGTGMVTLDAKENPHIISFGVRPYNTGIFDLEYSTLNESALAPQPTPSNEPTPSPTIPEFPAWTILLLAAAVIVSFGAKRKVFKKSAAQREEGLSGLS